MDTSDPVIGLMLDHMLYCTFIKKGLYQTAEVFRQETGAHFAPIALPSSISTLSPIEDEDSVENSPKQFLIINEAGEAEWVPLPDDAASSSSSFNWEEVNMCQQSDENMVEGLTLDDIFGGTDNEDLASVVESCQRSKRVFNEGCCELEDDVWDFPITGDLIELSPLVNDKKNEEGSFCSQDAYLYDASSFQLGNEGGHVISVFNFDEYNEAAYNFEIQAMTIGANSIPTGAKRKWFELSGDGEGDHSNKSAHVYGSSGKGNEDGGVSGSHQNNAYPD